jgi:hypothetical protein
MSVLIPLAVGAMVAAGPSAGAVLGAPKAAGISAPARSESRTPHWVRAPSPVSLATLVHARFSRRAGVSRVERGATSAGVRFALAPHVGWTVPAGTSERPARSRHAAVTVERGPPPRP